MEDEELQIKLEIPDSLKNIEFDGVPVFDPVTHCTTNAIHGNFVADPEVIRSLAKEVKLDKGTSFDDAIKILMKERNDKKNNCFIEFNKVKLYSVDMESEDDAYMKYLGIPKIIRDMIVNNMTLQQIKNMEETTEDKNCINDYKVLKGLLFIVEHNYLDENGLKEELDKQGCAYTFEMSKDYCDSLEEDDEHKKLVGTGANVIANYLNNKSFVNYYHGYNTPHRPGEVTTVFELIRKLSGNNDYTKSYADLISNINYTVQ